MNNNNSVNSKIVGPELKFPPREPLPELPEIKPIPKPPIDKGETMETIKDKFMFDKLDANNDGQLSRLELEGKSLFSNGKHQAYDKNKDGKVSESEFMAARKREREMMKKDTNMDKRLTIDEFTAGLKGEELIQATKEFYRLDQDKSGTISQNEFVAGRPMTISEIFEDRPRFPELPEVKPLPDFKPFPTPHTSENS